MILREKDKQKGGRKIFFLSSVGCQRWHRQIQAVTLLGLAVAPTERPLLARGVRADGDTAPNPKKGLSKPSPIPSKPHSNS